MAICRAVTGYSSRFDLSQCRTAGFEGYFVKPADIPILLGPVAQAQFHRSKEGRHDPGRSSRPSDSRRSLPSSRMGASTLSRRRLPYCQLRKRRILPVKQPHPHTTPHP